MKYLVEVKIWKFKTPRKKYVIPYTLKCEFQIDGKLPKGVLLIGTHDNG
jgi:lipid-binding SYLF domain-containing protein